MQSSSVLELQHVFDGLGHGFVSTLHLKDGSGDNGLQIVHGRSSASIVDALLGDNVVLPYVEEQLRKYYFAVIR